MATLKSAQAMADPNQDANATGLDARCRAPLVPGELLTHRENLSLLLSTASRRLSEGIDPSLSRDSNHQLASPQAKQSQSFEPTT